MEPKDKQDIIECLDELHNKVVHCDCKENCNNNINDDNYPSLTVWCAYNMFSQKIIVKYPPNDNYYNFNIFELLELDSFYVDCKNDIEVEKKKIFDYIKKVKTKLSMK